MKKHFVNYIIFLRQSKISFPYLTIFHLEYYAGEANGICKEESNVIRDETECINAIQKLGFRPLADSWTGSYNAIPSGCSIRTSDKTPHIETTPTGRGQGRNDLIPICLVPLETGEIYSTYYL